MGPANRTPRPVGPPPLVCCEEWLTVEMTPRYPLTYPRARREVRQHFPEPARGAEAGCGEQVGSTRRSVPPMERRTVIGVIAGGLLAAPLAAEAQQAKPMFHKNGDTTTRGGLGPH
jgi:hypothetical protein